MRKEDHNVEDPRPARRRKLRSVSTEALPAMQLEIDKYHLRLRGIRTRQLAGRRTPIVNGNVTILLARSILMVRSIGGLGSEFGARLYITEGKSTRWKWKCWGRRSMTRTTIARLIESVGHVGQIDDFPIKPLE
jgi:hypothetical protein